MKNNSEKAHVMTVYSQELKIPKEILTNNCNDIEAYYRKKYPGVQIRFHGLMFGKFPHSKRIPFIAICVDGGGLPVGVTHYYLK